MQQQNTDSDGVHTKGSGAHTETFKKLMFSKCRQVNYSAVKMASLLEAAQLQ